MECIMENTEHLKTLLKNFVVSVLFIKKDGSERTLCCTLQEHIIPTSEPKGTKKDNPDVLAVWDVENSGWRSFRLDSVVVYSLSK